MKNPLFKSFTYNNVIITLRRKIIYTFIFRISKFTWSWTKDQMIRTLIIYIKKNEVLINQENSTVATSLDDFY